MWVAESRGRSSPAVYSGHRKDSSGILSATLHARNDPRRQDLHLTYLCLYVPTLVVIVLKLDLLFGVKDPSLTTATSVPPRRWEQPPTHLAS